MATDYDPTPIPEHSPVYDGHNAEEIVNWVHQTLEHYELPHQYIGYAANESNLHLTNPYIDLTHRVAIEVGQSFTYSETEHGIVPLRNDPEILMRDHPQTVAEARMVQAAQRKLGVSIPEPGTASFVQRRAAVAFDSPTVIPGSALSDREGSIARHPSGKYSATHVPTGQPVVHHPPRLH